jgi:predicted DNA-binding ribbon-helix-helix protein
MVADIDMRRRQGNLSSAIRLFVLERVRGAQSTYAGHGAAGSNANDSFQPLPAYTANSRG